MEITITVCQSQEYWKRWIQQRYCIFIQRFRFRVIGSMCMRYRKQVETGPSRFRHQCLHLSIAKKACASIRMQVHQHLQLRHVCRRLARAVVHRHLHSILENPSSRVWICKPLSLGTSICLESIVVGGHLSAVFRQRADALVARTQCHYRCQCALEVCD